MDRLTPQRRSQLMAKVRGKNTAPEKIVRSLAHRLGYRFRLYRRDLPGRPDLVFPKYRVAIFVNGCFWHQHEGCPRSRRPTSNRDFWNSKLDRNVARDRIAQERLRDIGWRPVVVWECETRDAVLLERKLTAALIGR